MGIFVSIIGIQFVTMTSIWPTSKFPNSGVSFALIVTSVWLITLPTAALHAIHNRKVKPLSPPGWFSVDDDTARERYWDGGKWTFIFRDVATGVVSAPLWARPAESGGGRDA